MNLGVNWEISLAPSLFFSLHSDHFIDKGDDCKEGRGNVERKQRKRKREKQEDAGQREKIKRA